jgi:hypothetical protein
MASRSFKPSYLAPTTQPPSRSHRPHFTRTNSSSSNTSTKSDDSLVHALKELAAAERDLGSENETDRTVGRFSFHDCGGRLHDGIR